MVESSVKLILDADGKKQYQEVQRLKAQQKEHAAAIGLTTSESAKLGKQIRESAAKANMSVREYIDLQKKSARLVTKNKTEIEKLEAEEQKLNEAKKTGIGNQKELQVAIDRTSKLIKEKRQAERDAANQATAAYKTQQTEIAAGVAKVKELTRANLTLEQQHRQLKLSITKAFQAGRISAAQYKTSLRQLGTEYNSLKGKQATSFGPSAISQVTKYASSFLSIAAAVDVVRRALEFMNEEKQKAVGTTDSLVDIRRSLRQVSKGDFDALETRADNLTKSGISREQARQLVFDARSTGFEGEEATVAAADVVIPVAAGAAFAGKFRKFFSGDNLSIEQAFNTALAGAAESQFDITQLLPQLSKAAQGQLAGGESSDVVAAAGVLAGNFEGNVGDRLRALGVKLSTTDETKGLNLIDAIRKLKANPELRGDIQKDSSEIKAVVSKFIELLPEIAEADKRIEKEQNTVGRNGLIEKAKLEAYDITTQAGRTELARRDSIASGERRKIDQEKLSGQAYANRAFKDRQLTEAPNLLAKFYRSVTMDWNDYMGQDLQRLHRNRQNPIDAWDGKLDRDKPANDRLKVMQEQLMVTKELVDHLKQPAPPPLLTRPGDDD